MVFFFFSAELITSKAPFLACKKGIFAGYRKGKKDIIVRRAELDMVKDVVKSPQSAVLACVVIVTNPPAALSYDVFSMAGCALLPGIEAVEDLLVRSSARECNLSW